MRRHSASPFLFSLALLVVAVASGACNNQGPGDVCDVNAGNDGTDDCQDGLTCVPAPGAVGSANAYRCCPTDTQSNNAPTVCKLSSATSDGSTAAPVQDGASDDASDAPSGDVSTGDAARADAGFDATVAETGSTSPEAAPDAPADGGAADVSAQ